MKALLIFLAAVMTFSLNSETVAGAESIDGQQISASSEQGQPPNLTYYDYPYYRFGDCNGDGWCNFGDIVTLIEYFRGTGPLVCMPAGDIDGNGQINITDIILLILWLKGHPNADPPLYECDWEVPVIETAGNITIDYCIGSPGDTAYVGVYTQTSLMSSFHFSLAYDNEDIDEVFTSDVNPAFIVAFWSHRETIRENLPPDNNDSLNTAVFSISTVNDEGQIFGPLEFPELTWAFDIAVVVSSGSFAGLHPLPLEADYIYGPPMFFSEDGWTSYEFSSSGPACIYTPGDCNHNGIPLELNDVITMIGLYRGSALPEYLCACPPYGDYFAPQADPNGNCIPFELGDVVIEIGAYRGTDEASGCEDCPGSR